MPNFSITNKGNNIYQVLFQNGQNYTIKTGKEISTNDLKKCIKGGEDENSRVEISINGVEITVGENDAEKTYTRINGNRNIIKGSTKNDVIDVVGESNRIFGGEGDDSVDISGEENQIFGGEGDDNISIQGSRNDVYGNNGDDHINIFSGKNNSVYGGKGADTIMFNTGIKYTHLEIDSNDELIGNEAPKELNASSFIDLMRTNRSATKGVKFN